MRLLDICLIGRDVKYVGVLVLASKSLMQGKGGKSNVILQNYQEKIEFLMCMFFQKGNRIGTTPSLSLHSELE